MDDIRFTDARLEGGELILKPDRQDMGLAMAFVRAFKPGKPYVASLKQQRKRRSLDANAYLWSLINQMVPFLHLPPEEIYQGYIPDVGENFEWHPALPENVEKFTAAWCRGHIGRMVDDCGPCRSPGMRNYRLLKCYYGSSEYDTAAFSRLLELVIQDCRQLGIETLSERERSLLLEDWGKTCA